MDRGIKSLIQMNRFCDLPENDRQTAVWEMLGCRGDCPYEKKWYLAGSDDPTADKWLAGYNGTQYHDSTPTLLTLPELRHNAQNACDPDRVASWCKYKKVPMNSWFRPLATLDELTKPAALDLDRAFRK